MSNHFHLLLEIPRRPEDFTFSDEELLARLKPVISPLEHATLRQKLEMLRASGPSGEAEAERCRETILARMFDLSAYMKLLKGRFTQWFNRRHARRGTLWEERFKSVLVEAAGEALVTMAAYIDLNPVRAGLVEDPKDYRWNGYGEAVASGSAKASAEKHPASAGLLVAVGTWQVLHGSVESEKSGENGKARRSLTAGEVWAQYRMLIYGRGEGGEPNGDGTPHRRGFTAEEIAAVMARKGRLGRMEMLHCRVRYFSDGVALGTREFVNNVFARERHRFGPKRQTGARPLRYVEADTLRTLRDLRRQPIG